MGFRDFQAFNLAMLAKQVWRLIINPDSLCARVLKAKYYPQGDILQAGPKSGSSYTWQSILAGVSTFKRGHVWRVGNGACINIWTDPWIQASPNRGVLSSRGDSEFTKVEGLIDFETRSWNEMRIRNSFNDVDVGRILQIPINTQGFDDFIAWGYTTDGRYTVRSGYYLEWKHKFGPNAAQLASLGASVHNPVWKGLWKLKIPSKVKIFAWRALHSILPLNGILAIRHIPVSGACTTCHQAAEDVLHLLFTCPAAQEIWRLLNEL